MKIHCGNCQVNFSSLIAGVKQYWFTNGADMACFSAFDLLKTETGYGTLKNYHITYAGYTYRYFRVNG